jgi:hypothetical protein
MSVNPLDRRDFSRLSLAAVGGLMAGSAAIAQEPPSIVDPNAGAPKPATEPRRDAADAKKEPPAPEVKEEVYDDAAELAKRQKKREEMAKKEKLIEDKKPKEVHICRGLNTCEGKGKSGDNKCAGQGDCATTLAAPHECTTGNACRNQGGCNGMAGKNRCAGYGEGAVPILEEEWPQLRKEFEAKMARLKKKIGKAPLSHREVEWARRKQEADAKWLAEIEAKKKEEADKKNGKRRDDEPNPKDANDTTDVLDDVTGGNRDD